MLISELKAEYLMICEAKGFTKKTMINKRQELKQLLEFLEQKRNVTETETITIHDLQAYVRYKQNQGLKPQSVVSMWKMCKAFLNWCYEEEYITDRIAKDVIVPRAPKKVIEGFTNQDVEKMINAFSFKNYLEARNKCIIAMLADTGIRNTELRTMKPVSALDELSSIRILGKGNKERHIFPSLVTKRIMIRYERLRASYFKDKIIRDNTYFLTYKGTMLSHASLDNIIKEAGKRAGIEGRRVSPHNFRHYYAVQSLMAGMDIYTLARVLGHSDISVTQRYLQSVTDEQVSNMANISSPLMNLNKNR